MLNNKKIFIVTSTKGGSGKTIIASMILPLLFAKENKDITVFGLDDNNKIKLKSQYVKFEDLKTTDADDVIDVSEMNSMMKDDNNISIIDVGGGADTHIFLKSIKKSRIKNLTYIIPLGDDIEQIHNLTETINNIKKASPKAEIYLILNQVKSLDEEAIKEQFIGIYGSQKYGISSIDEKIFEDINGIYYLLASPLFSVLKNVYNTILLDSYVTSTELLENLEEKKFAWANEGIEFFKQQNNAVRLADDVIKLCHHVFDLETITNTK